VSSWQAEFIVTNGNFGQFTPIMRFIETLAADHDYEAQHTQLFVNGHGTRDAARGGGLSVA
jgi:hypothetical protein